MTGFPKVEAYVLGTAQLGSDYGVANTSGRPGRKAVLQMVEHFLDCGGRWFDTARAYGDSERVLGECLKALGALDEARIITKLAPREADSADTVRASVRESVERLGTPPEALLMHDEVMLDRWGGWLGEAMLDVRREGLVAGLGVSVYSPEWARQALEIEDLGIIEAPGNVFDRRFLRAGVVRTAREKGVFFFARSVYLQGLAVIAEQALPAGMDFARRAVETYARFCRERGLERDAFAMHYVRDRFGVPLILGAETPAQVARNCEIAGREGAGGNVYAAWDAVWPHDQERLVDPRRWPEK